MYPNLGGNDPKLNPRVLLLLPLRLLTAAAPSCRGERYNYGCCILPLQMYPNLGGNDPKLSPRVLLLLPLPLLTAAAPSCRGERYNYGCCILPLQVLLCIQTASDYGHKLLPDALPLTSAGVGGYRGCS